MFLLGRRRPTRVSLFPLFVVVLFAYSVSLSLSLAHVQKFLSFHLSRGLRVKAVPAELRVTTATTTKKRHKKPVLRKLLALLARGLCCLVVKKKTFQFFRKDCKGRFLVPAATLWCCPISSKQMSAFQQTSWGFTERLCWSFLRWNTPCLRHYDSSIDTKCLVKSVLLGFYLISSQKSSVWNI